jgi:HAMP domain-containing protein
MDLQETDSFKVIHNLTKILFIGIFGMMSMKIEKQIKQGPVHHSMSDYSSYTYFELRTHIENESKEIQEMNANLERQVENLENEIASLKKLK